MKNIFLFTALFFSLIQNELSATSLLLQSGLGEINYSANVRSAGMGGTSLAIYDTYNLNQFNPASWTGAKNVRFSAEFMGKTTSVSGTSSGSLKSGTFNGLSFGIPIKNRIFLGIALTPYSDYGFRATTTGTQKISIGDSTESYNFAERINETGGLSNLLFGTGIRLTHYLSLGFKTNFLIGKLREERTAAYDSISSVGTIADFSRTVEAKMKGIDFSFGALVSPTKELSVGLTFGLGSTIDYEIERFFDYDDFFNEDKRPTRIDTLDLKIPASFGAGISYKVLPRLLLAAEYSGQNWENFEIVGTEKNSKVRYLNSKRFKFGGEFSHNTRYDAKIWDKLKYRFGFNYAKLYQTDLKGNSINEYLFSLGFGFPFVYSSGSTQLDLAFELGKRGSVSKNEISETLYKLTIGITGLETWFVNRRRK